MTAVSRDNATHIFTERYRIYIEDTDAGGIVYHANHLKYYERCRRDWLRKLGMTSYFYQHVSVSNGANASNPPSTPDIQFVVSRANVRYIRPILLDSLIAVSVQVRHVKAASLGLYQTIHDESGQLVSDAEIDLACVASTVDSDGQNQVRPTRLPTDFAVLLVSQ